jgi:hypothetical protein
MIGRGGTSEAMMLQSRASGTADNSPLRFRGAQRALRNKWRVAEEKPNSALPKARAQRSGAHRLDLMRIVTSQNEGDLSNPLRIDSTTV